MVQETGTKLEIAPLCFVGSFGIISIIYANTRNLQLCKYSNSTL